MFSWTNGGVGAEQYPAAFDDMWRFIAFLDLEMVKTSAVAAASARMEINRDGLSVPARIWRRFFQTAEVTNAGPADLQGPEWVASSNSYWVTAGNIAGGGLLMPPRSVLILNSSGMSVTAYGVIHESLDLELLKGLM